MAAWKDHDIYKDLTWPGWKYILPWHIHFVKCIFHNHNSNFLTMFCIFPVPISAPLQLNIDILLTYNSLYFQKNSVVIRILSEKLKFFRLLWSSSINKISIKCCNLCNYNSKLDFFLILKHCAKITNYQCNNPANLGYFFLSQKTFSFVPARTPSRQVAAQEISFFFRVTARIFFRFNFNRNTLSPGV